MDTSLSNSELSLRELNDIYSNRFSIGYMDSDMSTKLAFISLVCYLKFKLQDKKPGITHYDIIKQLSEKHLPEDKIRGIAVVCDDLSYGCSQFPTFGLGDKEIPNKIKEIISKYVPF